MSKILFADANSDYNTASYVICGVPYDGTSCFRKGSVFAPEEMRKVSYNFETYNHFFGINFKDISIHDFGDLEVAEDIDTTLEMISGHADTFISDGKIPVMMGGEHSLTLPFARACKKKYPDLGFVVLDAHLDLREEYQGRNNSHACISRHVIDDVTDKYASIGIRSGGQDEYEYASENRIKVFSAEDVFNSGIENIIKEIRNDIKGHVYLSIDIDAIDPAFAPAVGTPEPYGITPRDAREVIAAFAPDIVGFDLVEITPAYDSGNTAVLGAKLVRDFIAANAKARL
jgi:agmatinase